MKPSIETATPKEIAQYLKNLEDIAWEESSKDTSVEHAYESSIWKKLYDLVFSDDISGKIVERFNFSWYDPDMSYHDDVTAFIHAFRDEYMKDDENPLFPTFGEWKEKEEYKYN